MEQEKSKQTKFIWTTKLTSKGQMVLPREAREVFGFKEGDTLILLGDTDRGIAIAKYDDCLAFADAVLGASKDGKTE